MHDDNDMDDQYLDDILDQMSPAELGERIAVRMHTWPSVDLDAFKRHLGHVLYPLTPAP